MTTPQLKVLIHKGSDPLSAAARKVESEVFFETFGNTPEVLEEEYSPYEPFTAFVSVVDLASNKTAGAARILVAPLSSLKSVKDMGKEPWNADPIKELKSTSFASPQELGADIATLAVAPDFRGRASNGQVSMALYHGSLRLVKALNIDPMVAVFDVKVMRLINRIFATPWSFYPGAPEGSYLGSPLSIPAWSRISTFEEKTRATKPALYEEIFGNSPDPLVIYPDYDKIALQKGI